MRCRKLPALLLTLFVTACVGVPAKSAVCPIRPNYTEADIDKASDQLIEYLDAVETQGAQMGCWPALD